MVYGSWDMKHDWQNFFCHFGAFLPFYPPNNLKSQNFEKLKKISGDIIILHKCTKNHYHRLYCSLDMASNIFNCYFSFWTIFCPFTFLTAQKIKILKNEKNTWRYHDFIIVYQKSWSYTIYWSWDMACDECSFHFGPFFAFYPPNNLKNQNFLKMKKTPGDIIILHKCTKNHNHMLYHSWDKVCDRCNCYFSFWAILPFTPLTTQKIKIF